MVSKMASEKVEICLTKKPTELKYSVTFVTKVGTMIYLKTKDLKGTKGLKSYEKSYKTIERKNACHAISNRRYLCQILDV